MRGQMFILLLTDDRQLRNLIEQLFIIDGVKTLTATTVDDVDTLLGHGGRAGLGLVIIDTAVFGTDDLQQQQWCRLLLRQWTRKYLGLPYLVIGSVLQKASILSEHTDLVQFLVKPFRLTEFVRVVCKLWTASTPLTGMARESGSDRQTTILLDKLS